MKLLKFSFPFCLILSVSALFEPYGLSLQNSNLPDTIKIGLLVRDNHSPAAVQGAEMAINKANKNGGFNGIPFRLIVRSMEGSWGTGSKEAVKLIFKEKVWALIGSHDGRNAHLVEQVATKAGIVFLSACTSDPTLSQAFVPWFFNVVPNDLQQADMLIEEIYIKRKFIKVATLSDSSYDSKLALKSFVKKSLSAEKAEPLHFYYEMSGQDFNDVLDKINKTEADCIVLLGQCIYPAKLIRQIRAKKMNQTLFAALSFQDENLFSRQELNKCEDIIFLSSGHWLTVKGVAFQEEYKKTYNSSPGTVAAYAYDGMNIIIETIRKSGLDRENIQKTLVSIKYEGVTGAVSFDNKGNRIGNSGLMEIKNGNPVSVER